MIGQMLAREFEVAGPQQMPEQRIDVDEVHVVVGVGEIAVAVQRGGIARQMGRLFGRRQRIRHGRDLFWRVAQ